MQLYLLQVNLSKADVAVSWFKGSSSVEKSDKYEISSEGTVHTLLIKNATEEDIAEYACAAENVRRLFIILLVYYTYYTVYLPPAYSTKRGKNYEKFNVNY